MKYPQINANGTLLALRAMKSNFLSPKALEYNAEQLAHEFSTLERLARTHTNLQVKKCNVPFTERDEVRERNLRKRITDAVRFLFTWRPYVEFHGDPRGATVRLRWGAPDSGSEWTVG